MSVIERIIGKEGKMEMKKEIFLFEWTPFLSMEFLLNFLLPFFSWELRRVIFDLWKKNNIYIIGGTNITRKRPI